MMMFALITATLKQLQRLVLLSSFLSILRLELFWRNLMKTPCFIMQLVISRRFLANCITCIVVKMESLIFLDDFTTGIMLAFFACYMLQVDEMKFRLDFCFILLYFILFYFSLQCSLSGNCPFSMIRRKISKRRVVQDRSYI